MGFEWDGTAVLVTGASSGIGAALARALAPRGTRLGLIARREDRLQLVAADCRAAGAREVRTWAQDVGRVDDLRPLAEHADDALGGIDVLVNNAGIPKRRQPLATTPDDVDRVLDVNFRAAARLTLALLPRMLERGRGRIVNVSSIAARLGPPGEAAYAASKAALSAWSESLAVDLGGTGVDVHVVYPGVIDTELFTIPGNDPLIADDVPPERPEDLADAIVQQVESGRFELWFPGWFRDVAVSRAGDIETFLEGTRAYARAKAGS